jgi:uncharacterized membrane protein
MNKKAVQWLYGELPELVAKGILSEPAAQNLRNHYGEARGLDRKWFIVLVCSVMGALLIGLGIILLLAHNWEELSRPVRAVLSLLPLLIAQALAFWVVKNRPGSHALKESSATFLSLMVGASIALISQTYNIAGDTPSFILTWMLLIVPLCYLMEATVPAALYAIGITAWAGHFWDEPLKAFLFWPLLAVVVPHFVRSLRQPGYAVRSAILALVFAVVLPIGAAFSLGRAIPGSWIVIDSSLATLFYLLASREFKGLTTNWQRPLKVLGGLGIFTLMYIFTFRFPWETITHHYFQSTVDDAVSWSALPDHLLTFLLIAGTVLFALQFAKGRDWMRAIFGALPLMAMTGYSLGGSSPEIAMLLFNVFLFTASVYRLRMGIRTANLGLINTGLFMLAMLVMARFFDSGIGFVLKGLVFILVGVGFLVTNLMVLRHKGGAA